ncbi:CPBP family intramembrane glutamic endopeptidase [Rathayibacter sp. KR2-224]|uniref:CPBP family intramembrane glutamic endopeptidase n=1 Tax=Rathayibacter sp. KR2-224 TaxID=3400913 RepID=UPI003C0ACB81
MTIDARPGIVRRILAFPLVWALIGAALIVIGDGVLVGIGSDMGDVGLMTFTLIGAAFSIGVYVFVMKVLARRTVGELHRRLGRETLFGLAVGTVFIVVSAGILVLLGTYTVDWHPVDATRTVVIAVVVTVGAAVTEELVFRGLLLQAIERLGGTWVAILVTAALFGGAHFFNPGADVWSSVAIAIEAGVLMGAGFAWRRSIPFVVGIHFAWNFVEGMLGIPVSGHREPGLFVTHTHGPAILTGGSFGIEASVIPVLLSLVLSAGMLVLATRSRGPVATLPRLGSASVGR